MMALFKWLGDNISFVLEKWATYVFRKKDGLTWFLKWWSWSLAVELGQSAVDARINDAIEKLRVHIGDIWTDIIEFIANIFFFNFDFGFTWINIGLKLLLVILGVILLAWRDKKKEIHIHHGKAEFEINENWFQTKNTNLKSIPDKKFSDLLHIQSEVEIFILNNIKLPIELDKKIDELLTDVNIKNITFLFWTNEILNIEESSVIFSINKESKYFEELKIHIELSKKLESEIVNKNALSLDEPILDLQKFNLTKSNLSDKINSGEFDLFIYSKIQNSNLPENQINRKKFEIIYPFLNAHYELNDALKTLNKLVRERELNSCLIHAKGGIGKTHFSVSISHSIIEKGYEIIYLSGDSFSGIEVNIFLRIKELLEISTDISFDEFLTKLNEYGQKANKKIVFVIDALNETTDIHRGFSKIWENGLNEFNQQIQSNPFLFCISTCRTSYLERINVDQSITEKIELKGFDDYHLRMSAVEAYFTEYKIVAEINEDNTGYFELPLFLKLFCIATNPEKSEYKSVVLGDLDIASIIQTIINNEAIEIKKSLGLATHSHIVESINNTSPHFKNNLEAFIDLDLFYQIIDQKQLHEILDSSSIASKMLQREILFLKELLQPNEIVKHTFQFIGGYLIAKHLINEYPEVHDFCNSDFFQNHLYLSMQNSNGVSLNENTHNLAQDILKFVVIEYSLKGMDLISHTDDKYVQFLTWELIFQNPNNLEQERLIKIIEKYLNDGDGWYALLNQTLGYFLESDSIINFQFVSNRLKTLSQINSDYIWSAYIYENWYIFEDFINDTKELIPSIISNVELLSEDKLRLEIIIWLLETNFRNGRDRASIILLEVGTKFPQYIFDKTIEYANVGRLYIYERLASISYGIALRRQNDSDFITPILGEYATKFYNLQFNKTPENPTYHYVIIDSVKHFIDLAIYKKVITLNDEQFDLFAKYKFSKNDWNIASGTRLAEFSQCGYTPHTHECPDPFRMDFVIYTIPRLIEYGNHEQKREALANIYQRLIDSGYETREFSKNNKIRFFYSGKSFHTIVGKVDRLGKKYSWNAFFEYAGYLLQQGQLSTIWSEYDEIDSKPVYQRLGDVSFEVSNCDQSKSMLSEKIYEGDLLDVKTENRNWVEIEKFDEFLSIQIKEFDGKDFTLLYGYIEYKPDANYDVRSYLLIDSFLVKKDEIVGKEEKIVNKTFDWSNRSNIICGGRLHNVYFGELYWADNIPNAQIQHQTIEINEEEEMDIALSIQDFINGPYKLEENKPGDIVRRKVNKHVSFHVEPTIFDYLWESDVESGAQDSLRDNVPSPNIGKYLNLKSDPVNFQILDENLEKATITINWEEESKNVQKMNFFRSDLLQKYLDDKDLVLLYQVKQFTHDITIPGVGHQVDFRGTRFFIPHIKQTV